jgi:hypothetical protein
VSESVGLLSVSADTELIAPQPQLPIYNLSLRPFDDRLTYSCSPTLLELEQTAEILCMLAENDSNGPNDYAGSCPTCAEDGFQSPECLHMPGVIYLPPPQPSKPTKDLNSPPPQSSFEMAPWAIYPSVSNTPSTPPTPRRPQQPVAKSVLQQASPQTQPLAPFTDEEWAALIGMPGTPPPLSWEKPTDTSPTNQYEPPDGILHGDGEYAYRQRHVEDEYFASPVVEEFLQHCLPPDTPLEDRRGWYYDFLSAPDGGKDLEPKFFGDVQGLEGGMDWTEMALSGGTGGSSQHDWIIKE